MKTIIIGGVAGGMSAATRLRRLKEDMEIIVFEKGPYVSFANCGLPYYVSGEISQKEDLLVQTPASLKERFNLDVRINHEVISIDTKQQTVTVQQGAETFVESYDYLVLSPGAIANIPDIKGLKQAENLYTLRNVPDLEAIMQQIETKKAQTATVIGAGFIGLEMAENLHLRGLKVTIIEKAPQVLPPLDVEMAAYVHQALQQKGINIITGQSVAAFEAEGQVLVLEDGTRLASDLTILSIGVKPNTQLAIDAGLKTSLRGGLVVDEHYQTSAKNVYAIGDAIVVQNQITHQDALISLASPANRQGRQVADVIAGLPRLNKGSIATAIVRSFNLTAAMTGITERQARQLKLPIQMIHVSGKDHASYYPGATEIMLKLIFNANTGEILGAQAVGQKGVDKRIDIIATAIKGHLTIFDLPELELTYAPPFGVAKDPVNMLGYVAINLAEGISDNIQWHELIERLKQGAVLLDVREKTERQNGYFKEALQIPLSQLRDRLTELDKNQAYIVTCHSGLRSYIAERLLKQSGFEVQNLDGAFTLYQTVRPNEIGYD